MKIKFLLFPLALLLSMSTIFAQHRVCGSMEVLARQLQESPEMKARMEAIEGHTNHFIQNGDPQERAVVTIPVVVHIVGTAAQQSAITDAQIQSQMAVLNADFRKLNADASNIPAAFAGLVADCEVQFCMAQQTPAGVATTGIERKTTTTSSWSTNDAVKKVSTGGLDAWNSAKYLNLWVCNLSGGVLGYAQFPGGGAATDGVVITYTAFGTTGSAAAPFNKGRTATHEVGHWLNLYHIWGDDGTACSGSDNCADTPNQAGENYNSPTYPRTDACTAASPGVLFMNYMDYVDDVAMYMFTTGQKARMQALFAAGGSRNGLTTSIACNAPTGGTTCGTTASQSAGSITATSAVLSWTAVTGASSYTLQWKTAAATGYTTVSGLTATSYTLSGLTASTSYVFSVQAVCSGTSGTYAANASFSTVAAGGGTTCTDQYEANNSRSAAKSIPVNTAFTAQIATANDLDWYKFANTTATSRIKIDLTTLPGDYDVKLYRGSSSTVLGISENTGTTAESIIYNTTTVSTSYYAYVYGYGGAFSNTSCYTLKVSLSASNFRTDGSTDGATQEFDLPVIFENAGFGMYPNPANDEVSLEIPLEKDSEVMVNVIDPSGKTVVSTNKVISKGDNRITLNLGDVSTGLYFVQVRNGETVKTRKLVVQK